MPQKIARQETNVWRNSAQDGISIGQQAHIDQNLKRIYDRVPDEKFPNPLKEFLEQLGQKTVGE